MAVYSIKINAKAYNQEVIIEAQCVNEDELTETKNKMTKTIKYIMKDFSEIKNKIEPEVKEEVKEEAKQEPNKVNPEYVDAPATEKQLQLLKIYGYTWDPSYVITRSQADTMIKDYRAKRSS